MVIGTKSASTTLGLEINLNGEQRKEGNDPKFQGEDFLSVLTTSRLPGVFGLVFDLGVKKGEVPMVSRA